MRKIFIIAILASISSLTSAQKYIKLHNKGIEFFEQGKYTEADSLISLAIKKRPKDYRNPNMYFDRAIIKLYLQDTSGYCSNLKLAADYNDQQALKLYKNDCLEYDNTTNSLFIEGLKEFDLKNYKLADSLLTLSINSYEYNDNVLLRGIARLYMIDTIGFCSDMQKIYRYDERAKQNFQQICEINEPMEISQLEDKTESGDDIYFVVEDMPTFNNRSSDAFRIYIQENLRYPVEAQRKGIQGRVFVQIDIDENGEVKNAKVVRGVDEILDNEALRVVRASPRWRPGLQRGQPITVRFTFPIVFQLQ